MAPQRTTFFAEALDHSIERIAPSEHWYRAALTAVADDIRSMLRGLVHEEPHAGIWAALPWTHFHDGIDRIALSCPGSGDAAASLFRYRAGASVPHHLHVGNEHVIVIAGSQQDAHGHYGRGAAVLNPAGTAHSVLSPDGCVAGVFWEKPVRFLTGGPAEPIGPPRQRR